MADETADRFIRTGGRKWKRWAAVSPDVRQAGLIYWRTSAKGNKWLEFRGRHVVVYPVEMKEYFNGAPVYTNVWRYSVNNNQRQQDFATEAEAQRAALIEIGAIKGSDAERTAQGRPGDNIGTWSEPQVSPTPEPPQEIPADGNRRIKG